MADLLSKPLSDSEIEMVTPIYGDPDFKPKMMNLVDRRPKATEKVNFTGDYPHHHVQAVIDTAHQYGVDPYGALAVAMQENNMGTKANLGWGAWKSPEVKTTLQSADYQKAIDVGRQYSNWMDEIIAENPGASRTDPRYKQFQQAMYSDPAVVKVDVDQFVRALKDKLDYGRKIVGSNATPEYLYQAYNGYGRKPNLVYGIPSNTGPKGIDDPFYGKRILALRDYMFKNNPEIQKMIADSKRKLDISRMQAVAPMNPGAR